MKCNNTGYFEKTFFNRETNRAACVIQQISVIGGSFYATQRINPFLNLIVSAKHDSLVQNLFSRLLVATLDNHDKKHNLKFSLFKNCMLCIPSNSFIYH